MPVKVPLFVILPTLCLSISSVGQAAVRCPGVDLSKLTAVVYVSLQGNDSGACGASEASPCKTIQQGITNCNGKSGCSVLVRYGVYSTGNPVNLADGVSLYGSCIFDETEYQYRSTVIGNPAIRGSGINTPTTVQGFVILGSNAVHTGEASVAISVSQSNGLILSRDVLASGKGGNGENGTTPVVYGGSSGRSGVDKNTGGGGGGACWISPPPGSLGAGGKGANYQQVHSSWSIFSTKATCTNNNYPASLGESGQASSTVAGGVAGVRGSAGCACSGGGDNSGTGEDGKPGKTGLSGTVGGAPSSDNKGSFAGVVWRPSAGENGPSGQVGSGGGGGGSGGYGAIRGEDFSGYPGGGGGGGGCGGSGGTGGKQGGASVPLVLFRSQMTYLPLSNILVPGPGGQGGKGGTGARGGIGGGGGYGYRGTQWPVQQGVNGIVCKGKVPGWGGKGGDGGQGGAGSGGAGGNGGPSFAVALVDSSGIAAGSLAMYSGQPGAAGDLGPGGQNDTQNKGADGKIGKPGFSDNANPIVSFASTGQSIGGHP